MLNCQYYQSDTRLNNCQQVSSSLLLFFLLVDQNLFRLFNRKDEMEG